ncbi:MAG: hypothetical protein ACM3H9_00870 [Rhodospirillaceae bacterium]
MVRIPGVTVVALALTALAIPAAARAQSGQAVTLDSYAGVWEGAAQTPNGEVALHAAFKVQNGKLAGTIDSSLGTLPIVDSAFADGKLTMTIDVQGGSGILGCKLQGDRIEGIWEVGGDSGPFWLTRPGAAAPGSTGDPISGTWAGEVEIGGQIVAFSMELRVAGDLVTGEMISATGRVPLSSGSWKDGALQLGFPYTAGEPIVMGAKLQDGKLVGVVDYNRSEATGTWTAARK